MQQRILRPTIYDVKFVTSLYPNRRRSRRAVLYHGNTPAVPHGHKRHMHPPKPPVIDTVSPGRRRPPPPPPAFDETMYRTQYDSSPGHAKHIPPHVNKKQQKQQQHKPSIGPHKQHTHEQLPTSHQTQHVHDKHQHPTNSLAAEFSEAVSGEQFVSNPRNQLEPQRMAKVPTTIYRNQLFSEVNVPKVALELHSSSTKDQQKLNSVVKAPASVQSDHVHGEQHVSVIQNKHQNTNTDQTLNELNQNYDASSLNKPNGNPEKTHNTNHKHASSKKDLINNEPVLDFNSLIADMEPSQHGQSSYTPKPTAGHQHDINMPHVHDSVGSHVTHSPTAHTHESAGSHAHESAGSHAHESAGSHAHESAGSHAHESAGSHAHESAGSHAHESAGSHAHESAGSHAHESAGSQSQDSTGIHAHKNVEYQPPDTPTSTKTSVQPAHVPHVNTSSISGQGQFHTAKPTTKLAGNVDMRKLSTNSRTRPTGNRKQRRRPGRRWQRPNKRNGGKRGPRPSVHKPTPVPGGVHDRNPAAELEGHFMSMFETWYNQKFQPSTSAPPAVPVSHGVGQSSTVKLKPVTTNRKNKNKGEDLRALIMRPNGRGAPVKKQTPRSNSHTAGIKPNPAVVDKTSLFNEFMTMFKTQMGDTLKTRPSSTQHAASVSKTTTQAPPKTTTTTVSKPHSKTAAPNQQLDITHHKPEGHHRDKAHLPTDPKAVNPGVPDLISTIAPPHVVTEVVTTKAPVVTVHITRAPTTLAPVVDPDVLADVNEARSYQGLPPLQPYQVDVEGNIKPYYRKRLNRRRPQGGNLRAHGVHSHSHVGMHAGGLLGHANSIHAQHDAIHRQAGYAMTPMLHREIHRLLRQKGRNQRMNLFGLIPRRTPKPNPIDPDLMADLMEAVQARGTAA